MKVCKSNKELVKFDRNKIIKTCMSAGAPIALATQIASEVRKEGYDGMTTDEIRMRVYIKLKKVNPEIAEQYVYRSNMKVRTSSNILDYFQSSRIVDSLVKETHVDRSFAETIAKEVEKELGRMRLNYVTAPLIREIVNVKLLEHGMESVRARYTRLGMPVYDVKRLLEEGSKEIPQYSPEAVHKVMSDQIAREYSLLNVLPIDLADAHMTGQIHIHDLNHFPLRPTTFSHDMRFFLTRGLKVDGVGEYTATAGPAKRPSSAFMHAVKVLVGGQADCSREQCIEDFNVILAPYVRGLEYAEVKQLVQMLFYEISQTSVGRGGQAVYATLSCDTSVPEHLKDVSAVQPGGKMQKSVTYSDFASEAESIFKAFCDVGLEGDSFHKPFIYPKILFNVTGRRSDELMLKAAELTCKFGLPYFLNTGKHFYGPRRGTIQHVTVNLPQVGYKSNGNMFEVLDNRMKKAAEVLLLKRKVISKNLERNLLPFLKQKAEGLRYYNPDKQLHVISYSGLNELVMQETGSDLRVRPGVRFGLKVVKAMMKSVKTFADESDLDFILTGDPKGICYASFAAFDVARYGSKAQVNGGKNPYYSKGHYVNARRLQDKLNTEGRFNLAVSGRTTTHLRLAEGEYTADETLKFVNRLLYRKDLRYLAVSRTLTICSKCGFTQLTITGKCCKCNSRMVGVWSRDSGHIQNTRTWNSAQRQSYMDEYRYTLGGQGVKPSSRQRRFIGRQ
ncbi:MAG: anaerobic ribonucleoside-triphosphate reductase [Candidatus Altiarchaeota archaeon]